MTHLILTGCTAAPLAFLSPRTEQPRAQRLHTSVTLPSHHGAFHLPWRGYPKGKERSSRGVVVVFIAVLLPPGLMCLALAMGRYEEWLLKQPAPVQPTGHAHRRHLYL